MSETREWSWKATGLGTAVILGVAIVVMSVGGTVATAAKPRFVDNGDGTITDNHTRPQWEMKSITCPGVHCVNDTYTWSDATLSFISAVNDSSADGVTVTGLGGHGRGPIGVSNRCPGVVRSLQEGGDELLTFFQFPKRQ